SNLTGFSMPTTKRVGANSGTAGFVGAALAASEPNSSAIAAVKTQTKPRVADPILNKLEAQVRSLRLLIVRELHNAQHGLTNAVALDAPESWLFADPPKESYGMINVNSSSTIV